MNIHWKFSHWKKYPNKNGKIVKKKDIEQLHKLLWLPMVKYIRKNIQEAIFFLFISKKIYILVERQKHKNIF